MSSRFTALLSSSPVPSGLRRRQGRRWHQDFVFFLFISIMLAGLWLFASATRGLNPEERNSLLSSIGTVQKKQSNEKTQAAEKEYVIKDYERPNPQHPCQQHLQADVLMITSITRPFRDHAAERNWKHTLWQANERLSGKRPLLWVFNENKWEILHGREPLTKRDFPFADCVLDVFDVQFAALNDVAAVDEFYKLPGSPGLNTRIKDGKVLMRKVAAIAHALSVMKEGSIVLWVDVDVVQNRPLDSSFLEFVLSKDVTYLAETLCWRDLITTQGYTTLPGHCLDFRIDTGVVAFRVNEKTRTFANWWLDAYSSSPGRVLSLARLCFNNATITDDSNEGRELLSFFVRQRSRIRSSVQIPKDLCNFPFIRSNLGMNDIYTFALALHAFGGDIEHGWFAYKQSTCEDTEPGGLAPGGHCYVCPSSSIANQGARSLISPFYTPMYLNHVKGGTAIMARQHTVRHDVNIKGVTTADPELLLPPEYFPIQSHIDHRLACGDKRSVYGKIWSLRQLPRKD